MSARNKPKQNTITLRVLAMEGFAKALAEVCAELHDGSQHDEVRSALRRKVGRTVYGTSSDSLKRFEAGEGQPQNFGLIVEGYALAFGPPVPTILRRAADRLEKAQAAGGFEAEIRRGTRQGGGGIGAKSRATRKK